MTITAGSTSSTVSQERLTGERALFHAQGTTVVDSVLTEGESPLKHSSDITVEDSVFGWKYPLWYTTHATVRDTVLQNDARSGIWYADDIHMSHCTIEAPKTFRRSRHVSLDHVDLPHAQETLWSCEDVDLVEVSATGDYFGMNSTRIRAHGLRISGNYAFDGASDIEIRDARILSKDAFWNASDVVVRDSLIVGEYLGWNSRNLTFENCTIVSLQGMCYIENLTLRNCRVLDTTLAFEYSTVDVESTTRIDSVINPLGGVIRAPEIGEIVLDPERVDPAATTIVTTVPPTTERNTL